MLVSLWMTRDPESIAPATSISEASHLMSRRHVRRLPVTRPGDEGPHLVGIVSAHDVARAYPADVNPFSADPRDRGLDRSVGEIMTRHPVTTSPEAPIEDVARTLRDRKIGALPVVRGTRLVGIITESDVFRAFLELTGARERSVRVTFDVTPDEDVFGEVAALALRHRMRVTSLLSMRHDDRRLAVVRVVGSRGEAFVDDVWRAGHRVLSVLRTEEPGRP
jgi:acetoin utilization protein AcuB